MDLLVEGRHFRRDWSPPADVGGKAAARNLADVAAMGAVPVALLVGLAAPGDLPVAWAAGAGGRDCRRIRPGRCRRPRRRRVRRGHDHARDHRAGGTGWPGTGDPGRRPARATCWRSLACSATPRLAWRCSPRAWPSRPPGGGAPAAAPGVRGGPGGGGPRRHRDDRRQRRAGGRPGPCRAGQRGRHRHRHRPAGARAGSVRRGGRAGRGRPPGAGGRRHPARRAGAGPAAVLDADRRRGSRPGRHVPPRRPAARTLDGARARCAGATA